MCVRRCSSRSMPIIRWWEQKTGSKASRPSTKSASRASRASRRAAMAERIEVHEVGLRDGLQNIKTVVPTDLKLDWIAAEAAAGVKEIEVCSFVPPKLLP